MDRPFYHRGKLLDRLAGRVLVSGRDDMSSKAEARLRAVAKLGGKCSKCAHSEPRALCITEPDGTNKQYAPYQRYRRILRNKALHAAKYLGYTLLCRNCIAASQ